MIGTEHSRKRNAHYFRHSERSEESSPYWKHRLAKEGQRLVTDDKPAYLLS